MSQIQIPKNWEIKKIGEITKSYSGGTPSTHVKDYWENGIIPWIRSGELKDNIIENVNSFITKKGLENSSAKLYPPNTILVAITGATTAKTALLKIEACGTQNVFGILPCDELLPKYLWYYMRYSYSNLVSKSFGGAQPHINGQIIKNLDITYPHLKIQEKIVQKLDYILTELEEKKKTIFSIIKQNKEKIGLFEKNWFSFIISKEIENHPKRKEWKIFKLIDLTNAIGDGMHSTPNYIQNSEFYFINGNNLRNGSIIITENTKMVDKAEYQKYKLELNEKTVLLSINGTIGNIAFFRNEKVILGKSACYINCNNKLDVKFLFHILQSNMIKNYFSNEVTKTSIYNLSLSSIRKTPIILPSLDEQKKIVQNITNAEEKLKNQIIQFQRIKENYENSIAYMKHIQSSVLDTAFSGKLVN